MSNPSKQKGTSFERLIADYLQTSYCEFIDRRPLTGGKDKGDLANVRAGRHKIVVECKNVRQMSLGSWVDEAAQEAINDGALAGVVIHKRARKSYPGEQFVTMRLDDFILMMEACCTPK